MIVILSGIVSPLLLGYCLVRLFASRAGFALQLSLGSGIGAGVVSFCYFAGLVTGIPPLLFETAAIVAVSVLCFRQRANPSLPKTPWTPETRLLAGLFTISAAAALAAFFVLINDSPHGQWDGWVIWNTHARSLATAAWRDVFSPLLSYTHPDYPLLLPAFIARTWKITGRDGTIASQLAAALFAFGTVGLLVSSLSALRSRAYGFAAGILLLSVHYFVVQGAAEYADVPVSFFVLATLGVLALANRGNGTDTRSPVSFLIGITASLAVWTKNEGWMLLVALAAIGFYALRSAPSRRKYGSRVARAAGGLAPGFIVVLYFKHTFATTNDYIGDRSRHDLALLILNPARYRALGNAAWQLIAGPAVHHPFFLFAGLILLAMLLRVFLRFGRNRDRVTVSACVAILAIILAGYCATLIISPFDIDWQIQTAFQRLLLQLLPAAIFTLFMALRLAE